MYDVKELLDKEVAKRACEGEVCEERLDPIIVARRHKDEYVALVCALFAYGGVKQIVKFLDSLDFALLDAEENVIIEALKKHYYRFQNADDITAFFIALKRLKQTNTLEEIFQKGYQKEKNVIYGINELINAIYKVNPYDSRGYGFLLSQVTTKSKGVGALKRWMMFLRWMVRKDNIDMGLWSGVDKSSLIIPLDTHTFSVSKKLGLLNRKTYDLEAAMQLTGKLKEFNPDDPLIYDFALYRIGQEKIL